VQGNKHKRLKNLALLKNGLKNRAEKQMIFEISLPNSTKKP